MVHTKKKKKHGGEKKPLVDNTVSQSARTICSLFGKKYRACIFSLGVLMGTPEQQGSVIRAVSRQL